VMLSVESNCSVVGMFCVYQIVLCSDEDAMIQSDPPLVGGSLDNSLLFLIIGDRIYVGYFIHR
jgi:hypothetical protein